MSKVIKTTETQSRPDPIDSAVSSWENSVRIIAGALWAITAAICLVSVYRVLYMPDEIPVQNYYRLGFWFVVTGVLARCFEGIAKMIG